MYSNFIEIVSSTADIRSDLSSVILVEQVKSAYIEVVTRGPQGPPGDAGNVGMYLLEENHLSEYSNNTQAQQLAQTNLGLGTVDPLAYYILAKA